MKVGSARLTLPPPAGIGGGRVVTRSILASLLLAAAPSVQPARTEPAPGLVSVQEITVATPDILAVEVRDPPFVPGRILALDVPRSEAPGTWVRHGDAWAQVIGPKRDHLRSSDAPPGHHLDRGAIDAAAGYGRIGGRRVVAVYRKSMPYESGIFYDEGGATRTGASFRHQIYLKLDGPVPRGTHTLAWPGNLLPPTAFTYDDRTTRALALRGTQLGHAPADIAKTAYLALWLPGGPDLGAVDFRRYGVKRFAILDENGAAAFSGDIGLRATPDTPEPTNGLPKPLADSVDADGLRRPIGTFRARDGQVSARAHGLRDGQRIALEGLGGDRIPIFATVAQPTPDGFVAARPDRPLPVSDRTGGTVAPAHAANRAGTFVFELDYSAWQPKRPGRYRLWIPGLGVSDPFPVGDEVWLGAARVAIGGLYNHRSGIALDGRFGYRRPAAFRPTPEAPVRRSRMPLAWSTEGLDGFASSEVGAEPAWLTGGNAPSNVWGGYMDAGDWDRRIQHVDVATLLLEVFEGLPPHLRTADFGLPRSSEVLDDPIYATADALPNLLHEPIWLLDFFRRLQGPDGGVSGGIESARYPLLGEPSFLEHHRVFAYAPDPLATYRYAGAAAGLARVLREAGQAALAELFRESALRAWRWAEAGFNAPDAAYADALAVARRTDLFAAVPWETRRATLQRLTGEFRVAAAAALFRLGEGRAFGQLFEEAWSTGFGIAERRADAAWDYARAAQAEPEIRTRIDVGLVREATGFAAVQRGGTYPSMKHPYAPAGWGQGTAPGEGMTRLFLRAHRLSGNPELLGLMMQTAQGLLGTNQLGLSLTTGIGVRQVRHPLHEDHRAMGVPVPPGITIYGFGPQSAFSPEWLFGPAWAIFPEGDSTAPAHRRIHPARFAMPYFEYLIEHPGMVMQQEYTVQQTIVTTAALWLHLAAQAKLATQARSPAR
ncbi:hypothetical protein ASG60_12990 [Methylobacterium sp. Leaf469]|uniref:glycoside hydrolase family 9 protein n=1 Tax=Methylobacterium sp. Leaf469 TaxID=1736387 RepID=UPI0006FB7DD0|nr:glycoside hydrolase family 9 protein [Methylobacterium sp. Leaf469]KQT87321.1 hypothetical protein ASG60_12990 [Methylobacterium sp. Leaf469]